MGWVSSGEGWKTDGIKWSHSVVFYLHEPMDCSPPRSSVCSLFQQSTGAGATASETSYYSCLISNLTECWGLPAGACGRKRLSIGSHHLTLISWLWGPESWTCISQEFWGPFDSSHNGFPFLWEKQVEKRSFHLFLFCISPRSVIFLGTHSATYSESM